MVLLIGCALCGRPVLGVTLTGLVIYAADDVGNPSGLDWDTGRVTAGQIWRTAAHPQFGLGVATGLPPVSVSRDLLNQPDMSIRIDLVEGENEYTFFAQWGPGTDLDAQYVLSCFFDGEVERPGLSVLFPLRGSALAPPPQPVRSDVHLTFDAEVQSGAFDPTFTTGSELITVGAVHFLPGDAFGDVDKVAQHAPLSGDGADLIGVLTLNVQPVDPPVPEPAPKAHGMQGFRGGVTFGATVQVGPELQGPAATAGESLPPAPAHASDDSGVSVGDNGDAAPPSATVRRTASTPTAGALRSPSVSPTACVTTTPGHAEARPVPTAAAPASAAHLNGDTVTPSVRPTAAR